MVRIGVVGIGAAVVVRTGVAAEAKALEAVMVARALVKAVVALAWAKAAMA